MPITPDNIGIINVYVVIESYSSVYYLPALFITVSQSTGSFVNRPLTILRVFMLGAKYYDLLPESA